MKEDLYDGYEKTVTKNVIYSPLKSFLATLGVIVVIIIVTVYIILEIMEPYNTGDMISDRWIGTWYRYKTTDGKDVVYDSTLPNKEKNRCFIKLSSKGSGIWNRIENKKSRVSWEGSDTTCVVTEKSGEKWDFFLNADTIVCKRGGNVKEYYTRQENFSTETTKESR